MITQHTSARSLLRVLAVLAALTLPACGGGSGPSALQGSGTDVSATPSAPTTDPVTATNPAGGAGATVTGGVDQPDTWRSRSPIPLVTGAVAALDGSLYAFGAVSADGQPDSVQRYDVHTDTWSLEGPMPTARGVQAVATLAERIYLIDGASILWSFDPHQNTWTSLSRLPSARTQFGLAAMGVQLLVVGGMSDIAPAHPDLATLDAYDPVSNSWTHGPDMPRASRMLQVVGVASKVYAIGGTSNVVQVFDSSARSWTVLEIMENPRLTFAAAAVGDKILSFSGVAGPRRFNCSTALLDTATSAWSTDVRAAPTCRAGEGAVTVDGRVYVVGGFDAFGYGGGAAHVSNALEEYTPP